MADDLNVFLEEMKTISQLDPQSLIRSSDQSLSFNAVSQIIDASIHLARTCKLLQWGEMSSTEINQLATAASHLRQTMLEVRDAPGAFQPHERAARAKTLMENLRSRFSEFNRFLAMPLARAVASTADLIEELKKGVQAIETRSRQADEFCSATQRSSQLSEAIVSELRELATKEAVATFRNHFSREARNCGAEANHWLKWTVLLVVGTIALILILLTQYKIQGTINDGSTIQNLIGRLVIVSILYLSIVWSMRQYRALRHLKAVNDHRATSLNAYKVLIRAVGNDQTAKAFVLQEAATCMFAPSVTGFLGPEENTPSPPLLDALKTMSR